MHGNSGLMFHKRRKDIVETFRENFNPKITITTNLIIITFLDVILDRCTGGYRDYKRPNDTPIYINVSSNYPRNIINALSDSISKRVSNVSFDKAKFDNVTPFYNYPVSIYLLKVNNRNTRARCRISSKLTIKTPERRLLLVYPSRHLLTQS